MDMPTPTLRKDGRFQMALPSKPGIPRRYVYGRTADQCKAKYAAALNIGTQKLRPASISEFVALHFAGWIKGRVSELTLERYDIIWRKQLGPVFGPLKFTELTPQSVQEGLAVCGKSASVRGTAKSLLGQIVRVAVSLGLCPHEVPVMVSLARTGARLPKERVNITEKAEKVCRASVGGPYEGVFWLMKTLGLRWGEVCGLKVADLDGDTLTIQRQRNNKVGEVPYTKKRKPGQKRVIGLPKEMADKLRSYINGDIYMFHGPEGGPMPYDHNQRKLAPLLEAAGVDEFTVHDFRSAAIVTLYGKVDDKTYFNLFGHTKMEQTRDYLDSSEDQTREALRVLVDG